MDKKRKTAVLKIVVFSLIVLCFFVKVTGEVVHVLLGLFLAAVSVLHIWKNRKRMKKVPFSMKLVDRILNGALAVMILSGILLHAVDIVAFSILHKLSGAVFCIGCILHIIQHKKKR